MGRQEHFNEGAGLPPLKTRYWVSEVGMVPPPSPRGFGQIDPGLHEKLRTHPHTPNASPLTDVDLRGPVRASQPTVAKRKVDRIPRTRPQDGPGGQYYRPPQAAPFEGGVHLYDGHHRTAYAMKRGETSLPMEVFDPDNPQHVAHHEAVAAALKAIHDPLTDHRFSVVRQYGFAGSRMVQGHEADAARAAFREHQNTALAKMEQIKADARTRWWA